MNTKKIALTALLVTGAAFAFACNGDSTQNDGGTDSGITDTGLDTSKADTGTDAGTDSGFPVPPALKTQVDRLGRPAINTALNDPFDPSSSAQGTKKDAYNADKNILTWGATYSAEFKKNLAIFDSLDGVCGNSAAYGANGTADYTALAGLTADDQIYMDTSKTTCTTYLAVELNATGIKTNTDCGGRGLAYDVIDATYGAVSGVLTGVPDGIPAPAAKTSGTTFPYLAAPQ